MPEWLLSAPHPSPTLSAGRLAKRPLNGQLAGGREDPEPCSTPHPAPLRSHPSPGGAHLPILAIGQSSALALGGLQEGSPPPMLHP